jgi:hypothetical protein
LGSALVELVEDLPDLARSNELCPESEYLGFLKSGVDISEEAACNG